MWERLEKKGKRSRKGKILELINLSSDQKKQDKNKKHQNEEIMKKV